MTKTKFGIDKILAAAVGIAAFVLMVIWPFDGIHPYAWDDVAIAAGLIPQGSMLPGIGIYLSHLTFAILPYGAALWLNVFLAKAIVAFCGYLAFGIFMGMTELSSGSGARDIRRRTLAARIAALAASFIFVCSNPMWIAATGVTAATFDILLVLLAFRFYIRVLRAPSFVSAAVSVSSLGILCAETPIGWLLLVFFVFMTMRYLGANKSQAWAEFLDPVAMQKTKWSVTFVFLGALIAGVLFEAFAFAMLDGLKAAGATYGDLPSLYASAYFGRITGAANLTGWCLFLGAVLVPFVLTFLLAPPSIDEDRYLSFKFSIIYFAAGLIVFLQLSPYSIVWFWNIAGVHISKVLLLFGAFIGAAALAWALFVLCVEVLCRDYKHIENVLYQSYRDEDEDGAPARPRSAQQTANVKSVRLTAGRLAMLILPIALMAIVAVGRRLPEDRQLLSIMKDFVNETLDEAFGTRYLFTDGSFDSWLRIEAKRRGIDIVPVSLMSGTSRRDVYVRQLGTSGFEDRMTLEAGAAEALRTWVVSKSSRIADVSVQIAFELFRLNRRIEPIVYGLLVRPIGGDTAAAAESVLRCRELSDRIVAAHESGVWRHASDALLKDRFLFAQFRLAVMSRLRAINLDAQKKVKESIEEIAYSDRLNMNNPSLVKILRRMDWVRRQSGEALTPREGLEVAMKRADFVMARRYAMPVLKEDPDEPNANFAIGMSYYAEEQFAKAEEYLKRVLKKSPDEPAVYNNIALICLKTGRLEEAEENVAKALKLKPDLTEIKDTANQVQKAKEARKSKF